MSERKTQKVGRRTFIAGAVAAIAAPSTFWTRAVLAADQKIYVRTPGGVFDDMKREAVYNPFRKETGIEVVPVAATSGKLIAMMESGQSELDLIDTGDNVLIELEKKNYLMPINYSHFKYTNPDNLDPDIKRKYHVGSFVYAMALGFNTKSIPAGSEPKSWVEFWDIKKFPQRRTMPGMGSGTVDLEFALIADGVPMNKLYPLDIDRAFKALSRIRSTIPKFWDTGALSTSMLIDNEVSMGTMWSTRLSVAIDQGAPIGIQWNQNAKLVQAYGIPANARNPAGAEKFIDYSCSAKVQARWLSKYKAIPVNTKAYKATARALIDPKTNTPWTQSEGFLLDVNWWADNRVKVSDYWSKWIIS
ncbi:MAG: ABC transporter substrate-binding protein [Candidimonas sp.]|nr:MAG: ABC transporter substrate-binding protein [Candidimonas sp.]TAM25653.1 MAG: ABC transporter substrate-binding protein [Candidimonas sp.]